MTLPPPAPGLEDIFRRLVEYGPAISYLAPVPAKGAPFYLSPQYASFLGYASPLPATLPDIWETHLHPDDRARILAVRDRVREAGQSFYADYRMKANDGHTIWFRDEAVAVSVPECGMTVLLGIMLNVTEQKLVEQALAKSEERYRRLIAATTDYIYLVRLKDARPIETIHSPASVAVTGYTPDEFREDPYLWITMVDERDREAVKDQIGCVIGGRGVCSLEHRIRRKDGQLRWVRNTVVSQRDAAGKLLSYDGLITDITDRKIAEEKLREAYAKLKETQTELIQAEKMEVVGRMASGVAHEVKNPLAIIMQGVNFLEEQVPRTDPQVAEVLGFIREGIDRADAIITALCDFSKREDLHLAPQDVNAIIRSSVVLVKSALKLGEITLREELEAGLPPALVDARKIEQVLINIIRNAVQAMPGGGTLSVYSYATSLAGGAKMVTIEVQDTGAGMAAESVARIFDPFYTTKGSKGTGLGLFVSKNIIDMHGGTIELESREGAGTRVIIRLRAAGEPG